MFDSETVAAVDRIAANMRVEAAILLAIAEVESAGRTFAVVDGREEPLIRFEGHYFDRRLTGAARARARAEGLASPRAGAVANPASQAARWRLLGRAMKINKNAALESTSWGLGQVMGAHWKALGFSSVQGMVTTARAGVVGQISLMALYIEKFGLVDELRRKDFTAFTRGYNGPGGIKAGYHRRMAKAYERLSGGNAVSAATGMLRMGSKGARVRELQALLVRAGFPVKVDGDFGPATRDAVKAFQTARNLTVDGVAGPETIAALEAFKVAPDETPGQQRPTEIDEVRDAAKGLGPVAIVMSARDKIAETGSWLLGIDAGVAQTAANWLMAGSAAIGIGLAAYGLYGWWKSRKTDEGDALPVTREGMA